MLLRPVLEEFFFRGVVQQGVVAALGTSGGVVFTAVLFALVRTSLFASDAYHATSFGLQALGLGVLLGFVRLASGSILASALLLTAIEASGVLAHALRETAADPRLQRRRRAHAALVPASGGALRRRGRVAAGAARARSAPGRALGANASPRMSPVTAGSTAAGISAR